MAIVTNIQMQAFSYENTIPYSQIQTHTHAHTHPKPMYYVYCMLTLFSLLQFLFRCIQLAGHSAGAHLAACLFDNLVKQSPPLTPIVKSLYLISGVYDVSELRYMPTVNPNNILSLDENNVLRLSPMLFDFDKWVAAAAAARNDGTAIHLYVATNDAPKLIGQSYCLERLLAHHQYRNYRLVMIENVDHFNIVENLCDADFSITKDIIDEAKLFSNIFKLNE